MIRSASIFLTISFSFAVFFLFPQPSAAQSLSEQINKQIDAGAAEAELGKKPPQVFIAEVIQITLSFIGTLFIALILYAGYLRFTAHGEEDKIEQSNKTITAGLIGLVIVFMAYGITKFVATRIQNTVQEEQIYEVDDQAPDTIYEKTLEVKVKF